MQQPKPTFVPPGISGKILGQPQSGHVIQVQQTQISGPIPAPEIIAGYERILPGSADRIIKMAEKEQEHRHGMERTNTKMTAAIIILGQFLGFTIGISGIVGGIYLVLHDKPITGFSIFFASLATLVGVFLYDTVKKRQSKPQQQS